MDDQEIADRLAIEAFERCEASGCTCEEIEVHCHEVLPGVWAVAMLHAEGCPMERTAVAAMN